MKSYPEFIVLHSENIATERCRFLTAVFLCAFMLIITVTFAQNSPSGAKTMEIGVARVDITPEGPIRLAGYAMRTKLEAEGVIHRLGAKALAFGTDAQGPSVFITVDLVGIPGHVTTKLAEQLSKKIGMDPAQLAISSSHTHGGPEVGNLLNILQYRGETFSDSLLALDEMAHISQYVDQLAQKLEEVTLAAIKDRKPALLAWGQGQVSFARNRRTQGGPVDPTLPLLRVTDPQGNLRAVLVNYACHGTTLEGNVNKIHNDWIGEAQKFIEANHPGVTAMIAIGCGADANPQPRGKMEHATLHGQEISNHVEKLLASPLQPLFDPPVGRIKWVKLPFAKVPTVPELVKQSEDKSVKGYYARLALDRIARGTAIPTDLTYPIQTWTFGNDLAMINLAGEVVVDYSVRLKNELGSEKLWVNAYANDVPCYIASRRVIREGGYEAESSMYYYDKPSAFVEEVEDIIIKAVHDLLPDSYKLKRPATNKQELVLPEANQALHLRAEMARSVGPKIQYMPEWKAFGWFTEADRVEWDVQVKEKGKYDVYVEWSVSDAEAGKPFVLEAGKQKLNGTVGQTGSWFTYKTEKIGRIQLPAGNHKVVFRPGSATKKGALMDLREVKLIPVK
ncbi:MAG: neutral/alkaline non-lysosomal ceramidase N-terminal domain-containing protein [Cyclobacteriaceae bacterium]